MVKKTVRIIARETVIYDQTFEMTDAEATRIKTAFAGSNRMLAAEVDGWIDRMNIHDAEPIDGGDVEVYIDGEELYVE